MRVIWVQQWTVLPVIVEDREMGDNNVQRGRVPVGGQQMDPSAPSRLSDSEARLPTQDGSSRNPHGVTPQQQQHLGNQTFNAFGPNIPGHQTGSGQSPGALSMAGMAGALPDYQTPFEQISHQDQQRFLAGTSSSASAYQYQNQQFPSQSPQHMPNFPHHPSQYASTYQQAYPVQQSAQSHSGGAGSAYSSGPYPSAQQQQYTYYPGHYAQAVQTHHASFPSSYGPGSYPQQGADVSVMSGRLAHTGYPSGAPSPYVYASGGASLRAGVPRGEGSNSRTGSIPSTPRGPPRKPRQSGHALWVGNLPSGTVISDLKDHFSRDATKDIESVFLISKSNCAFVNYRTEETCAAAMKRFHDSRFQGVRLVCRLRSNSAAATASNPGIATGPTGVMPTVPYTQTAFESIQQNREVTSSHEVSAESQRTDEPTAKVSDKYFVMKSLTVEDMELSVRNCIWATQSHNEEALNKAYQNSKNVYLIFSANKSGEYFGFARMASPITDEAAAGLEWAPRGETVIDDPDIPRSIPTAPTEFAPRGRIIDDSARGTIFWEADPEDEDLAPIIDHEIEGPAETRKAEEADNAEELALTGEAQAFGKPFKIEWISTNRLPFYRTRGLRNSWNANREVKIARDGTEIETTVGRRLIQMFQKPPSPSVAQHPVGWSPGQIY